MIEMCPFWTPALQVELQQAQSFEDVAEVAVSLAARMPQPLSQLCGPLSTGGFGCLKRNGVLFARCVTELRRRSLNPFDQMPLQNSFERLAEAWHLDNPGQSYCTPILEVVYRRLFESGHVRKTFFLPGWQSSKGTTWERETVSRLGIQIHEFPPLWHEAIMEELTATDFYGMVA